MVHCIQVQRVTFIHITVCSRHLLQNQQPMIGIQLHIWLLWAGQREQRECLSSWLRFPLNYKWSNLNRFPLNNLKLCLLMDKSINSLSNLRCNNAGAYLYKKSSEMNDFDVNTKYYEVNNGLYNNKSQTEPINSSIIYKSFYSSCFTTVVCVT